MNARNYMSFATILLAMGGSGCGGDDSTITPPVDSGTGSDTGTTSDTGTSPAGCPALGDRTVVSVDSDITADTTWTCDNLYQLDAAIYVTAGTLSIQPGVVVQGTSGQNALIVTTGGKIDAQGTAEEPIVFTSAGPEGTRTPGDWGGVVLLGNAPINVAGGTNNIEGLEPTEMRGRYGGTDSAHDCGTMRYVRIEFAGFLFGEDNELNGLTVGGCGSDTELDYIHVHLGFDDGVEFFGGTSDIKHLVVSQVGDDGLDWDQGWSGRAQFVICQQDNAGERCIEADNLQEDNDAMPRSNPTVYNYTFVGDNQPEQQGMRLRRGTAGILHNGVVMNFSQQDCIRVDASATIDQANSGALVVGDTILDGCPSYFAFTPDDGDTTTMFTGDWDALNVTGMDPMLTNPLNLDTPSFAPMDGSPVGTMGTMPPSGFFEPAEYAGAIDPAGEDWTAGWTSYPAD